MKKYSIRLLFFIITVLGLSTANSQNECYNLVWADEFNGNELDRSNWSVQIGNGFPDLFGWGNGELQYYSDRPENLSVSDGSLKITARNDGFGGSEFSSARIRSVGNFDFRYGRIEARIKLASGQGLWPAFWLLPTDEAFGTWPRSGEIDIMENFGQDNFVSSTIHFRNRGGFNQFNSQNFGTTLNEFHIFAAVWEEDRIDFFVDWQFIGSERPEDVNGIWPFNENFHLILNMALGGVAGDVNTTFPKTMEIDYVRVFQQTESIDISGPELIFENESVTYSVPDNTTAEYNWSVPSNATIVSGQGTHEVLVNWGDSNGDITCNVTNWQGDVSGVTSNCGDRIHSKSITVEEGTCDVNLLDFDKVVSLQPHEADGIGGIETYFELNPDENNNINASPFVGRYGRAGNERFDVLRLDFTENIDVSELLSGDNLLKMDVYSNASGSIPVTIEFVNRNENTGFPNGIHSQYTAEITTTNNWQTLTFDFSNRPDFSITDDEVDGINILFNTGTNTADLYYFDNLRTELPITEGITGPLFAADPGPTNIIDYSIQDKFLGSTYDWTVNELTTINAGQDDATLSVSFEETGERYESLLVVDITTNTGCDYSFERSITVADGEITGLEDLFDNGLNIFPNPVKDELFIRNDSGNDTDYLLITSDGITVRSGSFTDNTNSLNLEFLNTGVYYLRLTQSDISGTIKIVKQ